MTKKQFAITGGMFLMVGMYIGSHSKMNTETFVSVGVMVLLLSSDRLWYIMFLSITVWYPSTFLNGFDWWEPLLFLWMVLCVVVETFGKSTGTITYGTEIGNTLLFPPVCEPVGITHSTERWV